MIIRWWLSASTCSRGNSRRSLSPARQCGDQAAGRGSRHTHTCEEQQYLPYQYLPKQPLPSGKKKRERKTRQQIPLDCILVKNANQYIVRYV